MSLRSEAVAQGLSLEEYDKIVEILQREPNRVELGIFAVMWSEHCCYKSSKIHLRSLPTKGPRVVLGPGENAGIIDIGDGLLMAFKIESHNHPSFIEPHQGAATGVGGILRDIFTMGVRPVALLDSLHFGETENPRTSFLYHGVVNGIGSYGNCMGIPTVGGETFFDSSYNGNILVNAMAIGIAKADMLHKGVAKGPMNRVIYLGSKTGGDGIHGATMASQEFGSGNEERRPTVQVGDPFMEKNLMEASLAMMGEKLLVGIQDMGAAGLTCSTFEMSARGRSGMRIELDRVPLRDSNLGPYEIFLSESQERMLLVAEQSKLDRIYEIAKKWDVDCVDIGEVTSSGRVVATFHQDVVVDLPVAPITDEAPIYDRPSKSLPKFEKYLDSSYVDHWDWKECVDKILTSPALASKEFIYRQFDHTVGADTVVRPGSDAAVLRIKGHKQGIAATVDSKAWFCSVDPYQGTLHAVAESVRNLACVGAKAVAVTNCLNFGNPEIPEVMTEIKEAIRALGDACRLFETPVTGGNVSLYNQTGDQNIKPTPVIGIVGLLEDVSTAISAEFKKEGDLIALIGKIDSTKLYQSEFARYVLRQPDLRCPPIDLRDELVLQKAIVQLTAEKLISSAHDASEGGVLQALFEKCSTSKRLGFSVLTPSENNCHYFWLGEYSGQVVISFSPEHRSRIQTILRNFTVPMTDLGSVEKGTIQVDGNLKMKVQELVEQRHQVLERM